MKVSLAFLKRFHGGVERTCGSVCTAFVCELEAACYWLRKGAHYWPSCPSPSTFYL